MDLENFIQAEARRLGACVSGVVAAQALVEDETRLHAWLGDGSHGSMGYMERDPGKRTDVRKWFPEAKSILLAGFSYWSPDPVVPTGNRSRGKIARYALGRDYHPVLKATMQRLLGSLQERLPETKGLPFVDSSPVLERAYARLAGLGWIGKNTMLISKKEGSFFFLAGLALDIELNGSEAESDHCGTCTRCLDACPTDAFPEPRVLDASKCIAYFTIEHRGRIPESFRSGIGNWVFGCDICQDVCPWNRFASPAVLPEFKPELALEIPLEELLRIDARTFREVYKKTPMERARRRGLCRNALLAMGNSGNRAFLEYLEAFKEDPDEVLREQARWSIGRLSL